MRTALVSDVHGNDVALDAVLADLRGAVVDQVVFLGDMVQGGAQPFQTVARLRALGHPVVMGNADDWLLSGEAGSSAGPVTEQMEAVRLWTLAQLSNEDCIYLRQFAPTFALDVGAGRSALCFHGSPGSFSDVILPASAQPAVERLLGASADVLAGGHTHLQQLRRVGARGERLFVNPGSAGFAYAHTQPRGLDFRADPWAEYAVLTSDPDILGIEFRRIPFDAAAYVRTAFASGRPHSDELAMRYGMVSPDSFR